MRIYVSYNKCESVIATYVGHGPWSRRCTVFRERLDGDCCTEAETDLIMLNRATVSSYFVYLVITLNFDSNLYLTDRIQNTFEYTVLHGYRSF